MDGKVVVGVGNIYAAEALFRAGIRPSTQAHKVSRVAYQFLAAAIRDILANAINVGGTTLRDFVGSDGQPGYFKQSLNVYGRQGKDCRACGSPLKLQILGQRSTVYCPSCQRFSSWKRPVC
jgi:formamidopyrimidine-DNA glycosylase